MTKKAVKKQTLDVVPGNLNVASGRAGIDVTDRARTAAAVTTRPASSSTLDGARDSGSAVATVPPGTGSRRMKANARVHDAGAALPDGSAGENDDGRSGLRALIKLGNERGFVIRGEISDCLPERLAQPDAIENVIRAFSDMGIAVFEQAPDAESMVMHDHAVAGSSDEQVEEEAVAAISSVDAEFGRTTDPVRMYMREMGTTELLTRQGEIALARRIEEGRNDMIRAISSCPTTIAEILAIADGCCQRRNPHRRVRRWDDRPRCSGDG